MYRKRKGCRNVKTPEVIGSVLGLSALNEKGVHVAGTTHTPKKNPLVRNLLESIPRNTTLRTRSKLGWF